MALQMRAHASSFAWEWAVRELGVTAIAFERLLGITQPAVTTAAGRGETQPSCLTVFGSVPYTKDYLSGRYSTHKGKKSMRIYTAVIEKCTDTGLYVGFVPGFSGAHSQGGTLDELNENLKEVIALLLENGEPLLETEFVGTQNVVVA
jgi:predicted RNase H-like HicB family nuclease